MSRTMDTMNCDKYKLALTSDPDFEGGADHLANCADCRLYRDQMRALNINIAKALEIRVPDLVLPELPDMDAGNVAVLADRRKVSKPLGFAIAASVLIAAFVGIRLSDVGVVHDSIADQVVAHMDHEPYAYWSSKPVSDKRLARIVPANVATMNHDAGLITYAQSCKINGRDAPHLVIQGKSGPITIILMPEEAVSDARTEIDGESIRGVIIKNGGGSIAIIGEKEEQLDEVIKNVVESVSDKWSI